MVVYPGSFSYYIWQDLSMPMYLNIYLFNVTNYQEIEQRVPGVKPKLQELGPYVFLEDHLKARNRHRIIIYNNFKKLSFCGLFWVINDFNLHTVPSDFSYFCNIGALFK